MAKRQNGVENKQLAEGMRELRKGSRTSPHETRDKRLRTDERIIAAELELEGVVARCTKCGSPDHSDDHSDDHPDDSYGLEHIFDGERCIFCSSNIYDTYIYGPRWCPVDRAPYKHTTETKEST